MAWSAVTETELKMLEWLIPTIKDNPYNAITKIQELQSGILNKLNSQRNTLDLPWLEQDTLLDKNKRVQLYYWGVTSWRGNLWGGWSMGWWWGRG